MIQFSLSYNQVRLLQNKLLWVLMLQVKNQELMQGLPKDVFMIICKMCANCESNDDLLKAYQFMCAVTHDGAINNYNNARFWTSYLRTTTIADIDARYDEAGVRIGRRSAM